MRCLGAWIAFVAACAPPPAAPLPVEDTFPCDADADCVLIESTCGAVFAVDRAHAALRQAEEHRSSATAECGRRVEDHPVAPRCVAHRCSAERLALPGDLDCIEPRDCTVLEAACDWVVTSRSRSGFADAERAAAAIVRPPSCAMPERPEVTCWHSFCTPTSALLPGVAPLVFD